MSLPNAILPWSPDATSVPALFSSPAALPADGDPTAVAQALFAAGFVEAAATLASASADPALQEQAAAWRDTRASDAALARLIADGGGALVPSVTVRADGAPRFVLRVPDAAQAADAIAREHGEHGTDAELRLFLDEVLRDGDRFVDAAPGDGFAALTAATVQAAVSVIVLCGDDAQREAIDASARWSAAESQVIAREVTALDALPLSPVVDGGATIIHAGGAAAVAELMVSARASLARGEISAVAWRCGQHGEASRDAESLQVAAAVLGVFGFEHFAIVVGDAGPELVPAEAMASNEMIFSLSPTFLARFAA